MDGGGKIRYLFHCFTGVLTKAAGKKGRRFGWQAPNSLSRKGSPLHSISSKKMTHILLRIYILNSDFILLKKLF
jgi:hypothetical protein